MREIANDEKGVKKANIVFSVEQPQCTEALSTNQHGTFWKYPALVERGKKLKIKTERLCIQNINAVCVFPAFSVFISDRQHLRTIALMLLIFPVVFAYE